jgi:peptidoglycan LD-endopeptidase CwlK
MLNPRSRARLEGVHPDLVRVVERAGELAPDGFLVTEGLRSLSRQKELVRRGASRTLNSRHLTGHAVDVADMKADYKKSDMDRIGATIKLAAAELNVPIEWGGDWKGAWDTPHFQLPWKDYPAKAKIPVADKIGQVVTAAKSARSVLGVGAGAAGSVAVPAVVPQIPSLPSPPDVSQFTAWSSFLEWVSLNPVLTAVVVLWTALWWFFPSILARLPWFQSSPDSFSPPLDGSLEPSEGPSS